VGAPGAIRSSVLFQVAEIAGKVLWGLLGAAVFVYTLNAFLEHKSGRRFGGAGPYASKRLCAAVFGGVLVTVLSMAGFVLSLTVSDRAYLDYVRPFKEVIMLVVVAGIYAMIQSSTSKERAQKEARERENLMANRRRQLKETLRMREGPGVDEEQVRVALGQALFEALELWQQWWATSKVPEDEDGGDGS
jgi:hypothetical protein